MTPSKVIRAKMTLGVWNYSGALGFNTTPSRKLYARYTDGKQPANGVFQRYTNAATLARPLGPTA